jgi:hypothetical protein
MCVYFNTFFSKRINNFMYVFKLKQLVNFLLRRPLSVLQRKRLEEFLISNVSADNIKCCELHVTRELRVDQAWHSAHFIMAVRLCAGETESFRKDVFKICYVRTLPGGPGYLDHYSDSLLAGQSGDRIPVGAVFSTPVQTGPGAYRVSFLKVKLPGIGIDHPPHLEPRLKKE